MHTMIFSPEPGFRSHCFQAARVSGSSIIYSFDLCILCQNWNPTISYYPLVNKQKAIENGPVEIVRFTIENGDVR